MSGSSTKFSRDWMESEKFDDIPLDNSPPMQPASRPGSRQHQHSSPASSSNRGVFTFKHRMAASGSSPTSIRTDQSQSRASDQLSGRSRSATMPAESEMEDVPMDTIQLSPKRTRSIDFQQQAEAGPFFSIDTRSTPASSRRPSKKRASTDTSSSTSGGVVLFNWNRPPVSAASLDTIKSMDAAVSLTRQRTLPPKDPAEDKRHLKAFQEMMLRSKKRDMKRDQKESRLKSKIEKTLIDSRKYWETVVLPNWEAKKNSRKTVSLWEQGLPHRTRGRVWQKAVGNALMIEPRSFEECWSQAQRLLQTTDNVQTGFHYDGAEPQDDDLERLRNKLKVIQKSCPLTLAYLGFFIEEGPYHESLESLLQAFFVYRADVEYHMHGVSYLAGMFLLNMGIEESFIALCNLAKGTMFNALYGRESDHRVVPYCKVFTLLMGEYLPNVFILLVKLEIDTSEFFVAWLRTFYSRHVAIDVASRILDLYLLHGDVCLFRAGLTFLAYMEKDLLPLSSKSEIMDKLLGLHLDIAELHFFDLLKTRFDDVSHQKFLTLLQREQQKAK